MATVVMESTGVYWIPLFGVLEERGFQVMLVDPSRIKNVPGRKTDVLDCQWLQQFHTYGLLSGAFRPDEDIRRLRSYLRQRAMLVEDAAHHVQHMQKALTQMNLKLQHVISNITGKTGMRIIETIVMGERDPWKLAGLRDPRTRADQRTIAKSLQGTLARGAHIRADPGAGALSGLSGQDRRVRPGRPRGSWSGLRIAAMARLPGVSASAVRRNAPRFDVQGHLYRMTGVDLTKIDGVGLLHGAEGDQRGGDGHDQMAQRQALSPPGWG